MPDILEMLDQGAISDEMVLLYGISGSIPTLQEYSDMTSRQREALWSERLDNRLGQNWREMFRQRGFTLPAFLKMAEHTTHNWLTEGF